MKICYALNNFSPYKPGGTERRMYEVAKVLAERGHEPVFTTRYRSEDQSKETEKNGVKAVSYGPKPSEEEEWSALDIRKDFMSTAYNIDADIYVNGMFNHLTGLAGLVAKLKRKPFVYVIANNHEFDKGWRKDLSLNRRISGRLGWYLADEIVSYSKETEKEGRETISKPEEKFHTIYPAYQLPDVDVDEKEKRIIWIARFQDWKRPELFLEIAEKTDLEDWEFDLIGFGKEETEKKLRRKAENIENANYIGRVEVGKDWEWFKKASLMISTSDQGHEGFSNTFVQSWLSGTPVISRNHDPDNLIKEEDLGFQNPEIEKIAEWIEQLIQENKLEKMQKKVRKYASDKFEAKAAASRYEDLFQNQI